MVLRRIFFLKFFPSFIKSLSNLNNFMSTESSKNGKSHIPIFFYGFLNLQSKRFRGPECPEKTPGMTSMTHGGFHRLGLPSKIPLETVLRPNNHGTDALTKVPAQKLGESLESEACIHAIS